MKGVYQYLRDLWKNPKKSFGNEGWRDRIVEWRKEPSILRLERPTRLDRARSLGYKAKQGIFVVRVRTTKGVSKRPNIVGGRRPKRYGRVHMPKAKSSQRIAEEKAQRKYVNCEVLNSYWLAADGVQKWHEVIMVDGKHPVIQSDKSLKWTGDKRAKNRVFTGKTSAGKRGRGLHGKGKGTVKNRPSLRANKKLGK